jgi:molybdopterin-guanine dinucleotide biosynthesis protein A
MAAGGLARYDAIVLAGGRGSRLGHVDKPGLTVGDATLLDRVLAAVSDAERTIVVGPRRATSRPVIWCRESPAGGGPVAAVAAGCAHASAETVLLVACDLPWIARRWARHSPGSVRYPVPRCGGSSAMSH